MDRATCHHTYKTGKTSRGKERVKGKGKGGGKTTVLSSPCKGREFQGHHVEVDSSILPPPVSVASSQDAPMLPSARSRRAGRSSVDSGRWLGGSSVPASFLQQSFTDRRSPLIVRQGENAERNANSPDTHSTQQANKLGVKESTIPSRRIQHLTTCSCD